MKQILLLALVAIGCGSVPQQKPPSKMDSVNSETDAQRLIRSIEPGLQDFTVQPAGARENEDSAYKKLLDYLNIRRSFYKTDFDKNGFVDLIATDGCQVLSVMNYKGDSLVSKTLNERHFRDCILPKIINDTVLRLYHIPVRQDHRPMVFEDLVFKFGGFIEHNAQPVSHSIEKIEYETSGCFGTCPIFRMSISGGRSAVFEARDFNTPPGSAKPVSGSFHAKLTDSSFSELTSLLNYINFVGLKDNYEVMWTDDQTGILKITYDGGKVKTITDYGIAGTQGLQRLHTILSALRFNQDWK